MEKSNIFALKGGQYLLDPEHSKVFSILIKTQPHTTTKWDEMAMAELFAKCYRYNTMYCPEAKQWYSYDGSVWVRDIGSIIASERLKDFTRLMQLYSTEVSDEDYQKFTAKLGDRRVRDRVLKDAQSEATISITEFDAHPNYINCTNGTYDLETGKFHQHRAEDYLTMKTNCSYKLPTQVITFTRWVEFIDEITMGDKELAKYLQRALGYSLLGLAKEECMFIAYGKTTRNGKGTLLNTVFHILGDYAKTIGVDFIAAGRNKANYAQANPMVFALKGSRFVTMSESDEHSKLDESLIKQYTGGDPIATRQLYSEAFYFTPQFKMWLSCNSLPAINDKSLFSSDRIKVIEFNKHFSEAERDNTLKAQFQKKDAKTMIFMWLLEGFKMYQKEGLNEPESVKNAIGYYEIQSDLTALFVDEMCELKAGVRTNRTEIYNSYKRWCKNNGVSYKSAQKFYEDLNKYAQPKVYSGARLFEGIKLRNLTNIKV